MFFYSFYFLRAIPCVIRSSTIASITTAIPPSNPMPIFIWVMPFNTISPKPPADIMAATTTMESDIMMVWLTPARIVGNASGNCTL